MAQRAPVAVPAKRTFKKAYLHIRSLIQAKNADASQLDFSDFTATVVAENHQIILNLKETPVNPYVLANPLTFTYSEMDFGDFVRETLGFKGTYEIKQKDQVIAALPDGFTTEWNETDKQLTVKVAAATSTIEFADTSATLASALFGTAQVVLQFADDIINVAEKITVTDLGTVDPESLLEAAPTAVV